MARIRQVKPEFWFDEELAGICSRDARLFFIGLWKETDREGRVEDRPARLKAQIFPFDEDITPAIVTKFIDQLESGDFVRRYSVDGIRLIWVRTFLKHQHFHKDEQGSKLPEPPQDTKMHRTSTVQAPGMHPTCTPTSTSTYDIRLTASGDRGNGGASAPVARPKSRRASQKTGTPDEFEVSDGLRKWATQKYPNLKLNLEEETENFLDHHRAKGNSFANWDSAWKNWIRRAVEFSGNGARRQSGFDLHERNAEVLREFVARGANEKD